MAVFPGDGAGPADYAAWSCLPALPSEIVELPVAQRKRTIIWDKPQHLMFAALKEGGVAAPVLAIKHQLACETLQDKAEILASTGAGVPFILSRPIGRGEVFLFTVSPDRSWSDFPLSPFYLPVVHQLVHYAAGASAFTPFLWTTDSLPLQEFLPEAGKDSVLKNPEGKPVPIRPTVTEGQTTLLVEGLTIPGIYTLSDAQDPVGHPALAFNIPREESDLTPVHPDDIPSIVGIKTIQVATSKEDLFKKLEDFRVGKTLGEPLLWLVLLLAMAEAFYANWLMKKGPKLTDSMVVDPSGKVRGKD